MKIAAQFIAKFTSFVTSSLSCFDRVIFKGHLRPLSYPQGLEAFVDYTLGIRRKDFMAWAKRQSQRICDHARHLAESGLVPRAAGQTTCPWSPRSRATYQKSHGLSIR